jgi:hypothetical protein
MPESAFTKTGKDAWMTYNEGNPAEWYIKQVRWIASTTDGKHVIEEPRPSCFNNRDTYWSLRIWKYVFDTKSEAIEYANKCISEIKYIQIGTGGTNAAKKTNR